MKRPARVTLPAPCSRQRQHQPRRPQAVCPRGVQGAVCWRVWALAPHPAARPAAKQVRALDTLCPFETYDGRRTGKERFKEARHIWSQMSPSSLTGGDLRRRELQASPVP